jgi:hypothetical protein
MNKYFTNIMLFTTLLLILVLFLYYTNDVRESFLDNSSNSSSDNSSNSSSDSPIGTIVIAEESIVVGSGFAIFTADKDLTKPTINWTEIPGGLFTLSLAPNGDIFGTDNQTNIFYKTKEAPIWSMIPGNLLTIDTDGTNVCGVTANNFISCATINDAINGKWAIIGGGAKWVSVSDKSVYITTIANIVGYTKDITNLSNVQWEFIPATYIQMLTVSLDGNVVVGINTKNELWYADKDIFTTKPNFTKMQITPGMGSFQNVSLQNNTVLATDTSGNLWYAANYKAPNWIQIKNYGKAFMASQYITKP